MNSGICELWPLSASFCTDLHMPAWISELLHSRQTKTLNPTLADCGKPETLKGLPKDPKQVDWQQSRNSKKVQLLARNPKPEKE